MRQLCDTPPVTTEPAPAQQGPTPPVIAQVEKAVQAVRGLRFEHPVPVEALTNAELDAKLQAAFAQSFAPDQLQRRGLAWSTIGVIPQGTDLQTAYESFYQGQVVGFYVPESGELVFQGSSDPTLVEQIALAHELTHALDDQHFGLVRVDKLGASCQDERQLAALGAVEGSAQFFSIKAGVQLATSGQAGGLGGLLNGAGLTPPSVPGVPPFLTQLQYWPYITGLTFITERDVTGGTGAVNTTIQDLPVSTEQVIHPEKYPSDVPIPVDVPELGPALGAGWRDIDVMQVGEEWLSAMLGLRLDAGTAADAAAGWGGGIYRAWSDPNGHVAVVLRTAWDTPGDATQFAAAMRRWIGDGRAFVNADDATHVTVGFATDASTLDALHAAVS